MLEQHLDDLVHDSVSVDVMALAATFKVQRRFEVDVHGIASAAAGSDEQRVVSSIDTNRLEGLR